MSLSLNDIKYPKSWDFKPNEIEYMDFVRQEAIDMKVWKENNEKDMQTLYHVTDLVKYMFPYTDYEGLVMGSELMIWFFSFDELFDGGLIDKDDNKQNELVNRMNTLLLNGILPNDATGTERIALHLINKCKLKCGEKRIDSYNRFITSCIQWFESEIPFIKLKNEITTPNFDVYLYIRRFNVGLYPEIILSEILYDNDISSSVWLDTRWIKMCDCISLITALENDCISFSKEVPENGGSLNPLLFIQKEKSFNLKDSFKFLTNLINSLILDFEMFEKSFVNHFKFENGSKMEMDLLFLIKQLKIIAYSSRVWSLQSYRYINSNQPFIELRGNIKKH